MKKKGRKTKSKLNGQNLASAPRKRTHIVKAFRSGQPDTTYIEPPAKVTNKVSDESWIKSAKSLIKGESRRAGRFVGREVVRSIFGGKPSRGYSRRRRRRNALANKIGDVIANNVGNIVGLPPAPTGFGGNI